jgi:membrane fusion protein (multidrug efflux system)
MKQSKQFTLFSGLNTAVLAVVLLLTACSGGQAQVESAKDKVEEQEVAVPVEVSQVARGDISALYSNTATLEAEQEATVVAKVSEIITEIFVEEGDLVKKGQVLAQLNTDKLALELKRSEATLGRLKSELERNKRIYEKKMVSSDTYERLKFEYQAQEAAYELAKLQLANATITAPIDGVVSQRMVKQGNMVRINDPLFKITDFDPLHAVLHVPESEMQKLEINQPAWIRVDAQKGKVFSGWVKRISPIVDAGSGTFKVTVEVSDPEKQLKPGMFGRIGIVYADHKDTLLIDKSALIADTEVPSVFVIREGRAIQTSVVTGFENERQVEILQGLALGEQVVVAGQNSLKHDAKVEVLNAEAGQAELAGETQTAAKY